MVMTIVTFKQFEKGDGETCLFLPFSLEFCMLGLGSPDQIGPSCVGP